VRFRPDWPLEITGIFAEVREEAESDLSSCKLSPGSFLSDELPSLTFRALLTEGRPEQVELAKICKTDTARRAPVFGDC